MKIDKELVLSSAQALTATANSQNAIDLSAVRHIGDGNPMSIFIHVDAAADFTTGDETYQFDAVSDDNSSLSSVTSIVSRVLTAAQLAVNTLHEIKLPQGGTFERYLALKATLAGTTPSVTITAWLAETGSLPSVRTYPKGWSN